MRVNQATLKAEGLLERMTTKATSADMSTSSYAIGAYMCRVERLYSQIVVALYGRER